MWFPRHALPGGTVTRCCFWHCGRVREGRDRAGIGHVLGTYWAGVGSPRRLDARDAGRGLPTARDELDALHGEKHTASGMPDDYLAFLADRFRAAAAAALAFFARATRCARVILSAVRRPPIRPPFAPCSRRNSITAGGNFLAIVVILSRLIPLGLRLLT